VTIALVGLPTGVAVRVGETAVLVGVGGAGEGMLVTVGGGWVGGSVGD